MVCLVLLQLDPFFHCSTCQHRPLVSVVSGAAHLVSSHHRQLPSDDPKDGLRGSDRESVGAIQLAHDNQSTFQETVHLGTLRPDTHNVGVHHLAGKTQGTCQLQCIKRETRHHVAISNIQWP